MKIAIDSGNLKELEGLVPLDNIAGVTTARRCSRPISGSRSSSRNAKRLRV
jgi:hypothetical protein